MLWCYVSIDHLKKQKLPTHFVRNLKMCRFADNLRLYICLDPQIALFPAQFPSRRQKKMLQVCYIFKTSSGPISRIELSVQKIFRESESVGTILRGGEMLSPIPRKMSISFYFPQSWEKLLAFSCFSPHKEFHLWVITWSLQFNGKRKWMWSECSWMQCSGSKKKDEDSASWHLDPTVHWATGCLNVHWVKDKNSPVPDQIISAIQSFLECSSHQPGIRESTVHCALVLCSVHCA